MPTMFLVNNRVICAINPDDGPITNNIVYIKLTIFLKLTICICGETKTLVVQLQGRTF